MHQSMTAQSAIVIKTYNPLNKPGWIPMDQKQDYSGYANQVSSLDLNEPNWALVYSAIIQALPLSLHFKQLLCKLRWRLN